MIALVRNMLERIRKLEEFRDGFRLYGKPPTANSSQIAAKALDDEHADIIDKLHHRHRQWRDED